jgi:rhomboid family GlyGly-CTERM serine protease
VIALLGDAAGELLKYQRASILSGEWWRLFTGHLVHLGWSHLWLNLAGLLLIWALVGRAMTLRQWLLLISLSLILISVGLLLWLPNLMWYVGLSGMLHGLLVAGGLSQALRGEREGLILVLVVMGKVGWELWQGPLPGSREVTGGEVVVQAHTLGAGAGVLYVMVLTGWQRWRHT